MADDPTVEDTEDTEVEEVEETEEDSVDPPADKVEPAKPVAPKPAPPRPTYKPPTQAEFAELQRKLKESNAENAKRRKEAEALKRERETEQEKAVREAAEAERASAKPRIIRAEAKVALLAADARPERVAALTKFLDIDQIDIDDKDNVTGLEDQVATLKDEYPEFFRQEPAEEPKKPTPKATVGSKPRADQARTIGEMIEAKYKNAS